jgi:hypothetical protein
MNEVICPKCKNVIFVPEGKDFVICCSEVIYVINESQDSKNERNS